MTAVTSLKMVFGSDLRTLALFRVCLGLLILVDLINRAKSLSAHYTDFGVWPRYIAIHDSGIYNFSLHLANSTQFFQVCLFLIAAILAIALIVGYRTKLVAVLSWVLLISLQDRNVMLLQGGDILFRLLMFWALFLPIGARYSIDAIRRPLILNESNEYFSFASVALKIQCMSVYFFGALIKATGTAWIPDGTAIYYALNIDQLTSPLGLWVKDFPALILQSLTYFVWGLQMFGPILMLSPLYFLPLRYLMMFSFISMHISFIILMEIGLFPFISIVSLLTFTPSAFWDYLARKWQRRQKVDSLYYQKNNPASKYLVRCLQVFTFHLNRPVEESDSPDLNGSAGSLIVSDTNGDRYIGWFGFILLLKSSLLFLPLYWLLNNKVAKNGFGFSWRVIQFVLRVTLPRFKPAYLIRETGRWNISERKVITALVLFLMLMLFYWNTTLLPQVKPKLAFPEPFKSIMYGLHLDQQWNMFAPKMYKRDGWFVIRGKRADGMVVDVFRMQVGEPNFAKPVNVHAMYGNQRWTKYHFRIHSTKRTYERKAYGQFLCRTWNKYYKGSKKLAVLKIYYVLEQTPARGKQIDLRTQSLWSGYCHKKYKDMLPNL